MNALAFDIGTKYIGIAIFIPKYTFLPLKTINYRGKITVLKTELAKIKHDYSNIQCIILGKPTYKKSFTFIKDTIMPVIKESFSDAKLLWVLEDNSTLEAQSLIILENNMINLNRKYKRKAKKHGIIDSASALILLQRAYEKGIIPCNKYNN